MNSPTRALSDAERLAWLRLSRSENIGPITFFQLLRHFGSAVEALRGAPELARRGGGRRRLRLFPEADAEREIEALAGLGGRLIAAWEPAYPAALAASLRGAGEGAEPSLLAALPSLAMPALFLVGELDTRHCEAALEMATINGARALGLDADIGSIEAGKKADLVLFDTRRVEWRTLFNPVNNLVYNADGRSVHTVVVDGRVVVEDHEPLFVDQWELIQKVQDLGENLLARTGISFPSRWPIV